MRIAPRLVVYPLLGLALLVGAWAVHHSAADASWLSRQRYSLEALLAAANVHCQGPDQALLRPVLAAARRAGSLHSQIVYVAPGGQASHCTGAPLGQSPNATARYRYASLTKLLTAQAVLEALAEAALPTTTPLSHWLPALHQARDARWQQVTVDQLLRHRAGLDRLHSPDPMTRHGVAPWCPGDLEPLQRVELDFDPGTASGYSNLSYCLLGVVLEQLTGQPYRQAMEQRFQLARRGLAFIDGPYLADEVGYDFRHSGFYGESYHRWLDFPALSSSAGLSGTAAALADLLHQLQHSGRLRVTDYAPIEGCRLERQKDCYGYAVFPWQPDPALRVEVQQGYVFGASSLAVLDQHGGVLVWLGNGSAPQGQAAGQLLEDLYPRLLAHYQ